MGLTPSSRRPEEAADSSAWVDPWDFELQDSADSPPDYFDEPSPTPLIPSRRRRPWKWVAIGVAVIAIAWAAPKILTPPPDIPAAATPEAETTTPPTASPTAEPSPEPVGETSEAPSPETSDAADADLDVAEVASDQETSATSALSTLEQLTVGKLDPWNDYTREEFGLEAWADTDGNGCDQRNDVLARDLEKVSYRGNSCLVDRGTFHDPYGGATISFQRGWGTSIEVQIDHVVALADAWRKGAQDWDPGMREEFANDLLNLLASDGDLNQDKQASDASDWLPPNRAFRCAYVARQVAVKVKYDLRVTKDERAAMSRVLKKCPKEPLPTE